MRSHRLGLLSPELLASGTLLTRHATGALYTWVHDSDGYRVIGSDYLVAHISGRTEPEADWFDKTR